MIKELNEAHTAELESLRSQLGSSKQSEQTQADVDQKHQEEISRMRDEMASAHALELNRVREELSAQLNWPLPKRYQR